MKGKKAVYTFKCLHKHIGKKGRGRCFTFKVKLEPEYYIQKNTFDNLYHRHSNIGPTQAPTISCPRCGNGDRLELLHFKSKAVDEKFWF